MSETYTIIIWYCNNIMLYRYEQWNKKININILNN